MSNRRRPLIIALAVLLLLPLSVSVARAADLAGAMKYVPQGAFAVVASDLDKVKGSALYRKAVRMALEEPGTKEELARLRKATGIDPLKDIKSAVVAFDPTVTKDDDQFVAIVEAKVDEARLVAFLTSEGQKLQPQTGPSGKYYLLGDKQDGVLAFRGDFLIVGAGKVALAALKKQGPNARLGKIVAKVNKYPLFAAVDLPPPIVKELAREDKRLGKFKSFALGVDLQSGIAVDATGELVSAAAATELERLANEALKEARQAAELRSLGLAKFVDAVTVVANGAELRAKLALSAADVSALIVQFDKLRH